MARREFEFDWDMLSEEDETDEELHNARPRRCILERLDSMQDRGCKAFLRMDRDNFDELLDLIQDDAVFNSTGDEQQEDPACQMAVALSRLGSNGSSASSHIPMVWDRSARTCRTYIERGIQALVALSRRYPSWPTPAQRRVHATRMAEKKFPGCVGFIVETTFALPQDPLSNRYLRPYNVQLVCDMDGRILLTFLGSSKRQGLPRSALGKVRDQYFSKGEYLLADSTYPPSTTCVPPFKGADLTLDQTRFNARLARVRKVQGCINLLKLKWGSLAERPEFRAQDAIDIDRTKIANWICACATLHNFMLDQRETQESRMRRRANTAGAATLAPVEYGTGEELRESLVQAGRRVSRKSGGIAKRSTATGVDATNGN